MSMFIMTSNMDPISIVGLVVIVLIIICLTCMMKYTVDFMWFLTCPCRSLYTLCGKMKYSDTDAPMCCTCDCIV